MTRQNSREVFSDSEARLRQSLNSAAIDESAIKGAVCAYVDDMKAQGWPVERVVISVKRVAEAEDGLLARAAGAGADELARAKQLLSRAITWCVQHYFWTDRR